MSGMKSTRQLVVSKSIANKLHLHTGNKVYAYFLGDEDVKTRVFEVAGIYQTNLTKYDDIYCFADLYTISRLNGWTCSPEEGLMEVTGCELLINDFDSLDVVEDRIIDNVNKTLDSEGNTLSSLTIKDINPQIFSWLDLLDLNVWIILALMVCVAVFTMISGLLIIILERTSVIGLLKALGARNALVRKTFRWLAVFIVVKGMLIGNVLGIGLCLLQQYTGLVKLDAETYYVAEVPIEINWGMILLLNVATLLICVASLVLPSFFASKVNPAQVIRIE
jgi:lipoprotein-releasing system permease protein